jgi:predicted enzyme related to lactoylglutathione lyase
MAEFTEYAPGQPSWVDLQSTDPDKGEEFYRGLFGWDVQNLGAEAGNYRFFLKDGKMVAGGGPIMGGTPGIPSHWMTYVCVSDADATAKKVVDAGGKVFAEPFDVMTAGRMGVFADPAGAVFGVWQPKDHKGAQIANESNAWSWSENQTRDLAAAKKFYGAVFGWTTSEMSNAGMEYTIYENGGKTIGGSMQMDDEHFPKEVPSNWLTYFSVDDADGGARKARELGGTVIVEPTDIPTVGRFAVVSDPQGAVFGIIKPLPTPES